ncbi:pheromone-regulated protein prm10 [Marasmius sp. AFHP31]|nr:pheromone-regulated protein prm10 [Marasmius sp. AFHP31]KAK1228756.1 pheromone-regulated protein prm10 [Marasmius sp. AFHP31]
MHTLLILVSTVLIKAIYLHELATILRYQHLDVINKHTWVIILRFVERTATSRTAGFLKTTPPQDLFAISPYFSSRLSPLEDITLRRKFLLKLAKALLTFGAPSHRIQSQLAAASDILGGDAEFVHLPNIIIVSIRNGDGPSLTYFVRATGRVALTSLHQVHQIYREVLHDNMGAEAGTQALRQLLREHPIYPLYVRCILAFFSASIICVVSFGGSFLDMWISGACACVLQYLGLSAANKSAMYANVYELISIIVAFIARALSNVPGNLFCYSAISSAGVVLILPGFTVLVSALELMSKNIFCGSVRIVYAIIYTLFLGFGLTIGSDFYLVVDRRARKAYYTTSNALTNLTYVHGHFEFSNGSSTSIYPSGVIGYSNPLSYDQHHIVKGIAQGGGVTQNFRSSAEQYSTGFSLGLRMLSVASGVSIGLFVSQMLVYLFGQRKNAAHFAF